MANEKGNGNHNGTSNKEDQPSQKHYQNDEIPAEKAAQAIVLEGLLDKTSRIVTEWGPYILSRGCTQIEAYTAITACLEYLIETRISLDYFKKVQEKLVEEETLRRGFEKECAALKEELELERLGHHVRDR